MYFHNNGWHTFPNSAFNIPQAASTATSPPKPTTPKAKTGKYWQRGDDGKVWCTYPSCGLSFENAVKTNAHYKNTHRIDPTDVKRTPKATSHYWRNLGEGQYVCVRKNCGLVFDTSDMADRHYRQEHIIKKVDREAKCGYSMATDNGMFMCVRKECGWLGGTALEIEQHYRNVHLSVPKSN